MGSVSPLLQELAGIAQDGLGRGLSSIGGEFQARLLEANQLGAGRLGAMPSPGAMPSLGGVLIEAGLDLDLSDEQMQRLAEAADRAMAAGASSALVMIDGKALRLDVQSRRITGEVSLMHGDVLTGIDAVVQASDPAQTSAFGGLLQSGGSALGIHPEILKALLK